MPPEVIVSKQVGIQSLLSVLHLCTRDSLQDVVICTSTSRTHRTPRGDESRKKRALAGERCCSHCWSRQHTQLT